MIRFFTKNNKLNLRNFCTINNNNNNNSTTFNKVEDYYDDENPENQTFNWLTKRIDKKVNKYEKSTEIKNDNDNQQQNNSVPISKGNNTTNTFNNQFEHYFKLLKDEFLQEELKNASIEIQSNKPIDRSNLTLATLIRVCGKLTDEESRVKEIVKKLLALNGINQYTIDNLQDLENFKFSLDQAESLMSEYILRGKNIMVKQVFEFIQMNKDRFSDFKQIEKHEPIYYLLMESYSNDGDIENLLKLSKEMTENGINQNQLQVLNFVCLGYSNSNQGEKAYQYLQNNLDSLNQKEDVDIQTLNSILNCFSRQGNIKLMEQLYNEMKRFNSNKIDHYTVQYLIEGYLKVDRVDKSIELLKQFDQSPLPNTTQTFNQIFIHLGKKNRLVEMIDLFENVMMRSNKPMVESLSTETDFELLAKQPDQITTNFSPNINTINYLINSCCQSNNMDKAFELFNKLIPKYNLKPNSETYSNLEAISFKFKRMDLYNKYCSNDFHIIKKED